MRLRPWELLAIMAHVCGMEYRWRKSGFAKGVDYMKKIIPWILATAVIMLVFPWLAVTFIKGDGGMAVCFILFFAVNPIYAICSGAYAGKNIKIFWTLPIITALFFLLGTWLFFSMGEKAFILYALGYLLLGIVAELISMFVKKKHLRS